MLPYGLPHMTDRELLVMTLERVEQVHDAVFGPPSIAERLTVVETLVSERTGPSKKVAAGISGVVAAVVVGVLDYMRKAGT